MLLWPGSIIALFNVIFICCYFLLFLVIYIIFVVVVVVCYFHRLIIVAFDRYAKDDFDIPVPYYIKTSTIDALKKAMPFLTPGTPVLLDEVTPSAKRGTRPSSSTDEVVKITTVADSTVVDARYSDIIVGEQVPRIFTSNAPSPEAWFSELPKQIKYLTPAERLEQCNPFAIAVIKRCLFVKIEGSLIPEAMRQNFNASKKDAASKRMRLT